MYHHHQNPKAVSWIEVRHHTLIRMKYWFKTVHLCELSLNLATLHQMNYNFINLIGLNVFYWSSLIVKSKCHFRNCFMSIYTLAHFQNLVHLIFFLNIKNLYFPSIWHSQNVLRNSTSQGSGNLISALWVRAQSNIRISFHFAKHWLHVH